MSPDLGQLTVELKMRSAKRHAQVTPEFLDCTDGDLKEHVRLVHLIKRWKSMTQFKYAFHPDELKRTVERLEVELIGEVVWRLEQEPDPKREMSSTQFLPGDLSPIDILHSRDYWKKVYELFRATKLEQILQTLRKLLGGGGATNKTIMDCRDNLNLVLADTTLAAILLDPQKLFDCQFHQTKTWELVSVGGTVISEIEAAVLTVPKVETPGYFTGFQGLFAAKAKEPPKREDAVKVKLVEFSCKQTPEEAAQLLWDRLSLPQSGAIPRAFLHPTLGFSGHTLVASRNKDSDGSFLESFTDSPVHGPSITQLEDSYRRHEEGRAFFQAEDSLGFGPNDVKEQDEIWLLQGAKVPYILRKKDDHYILIGECYLQGAMPEEYYTGHYEEPVPMAECYKEKLNADPEEIELQ
ncbi:hypothetical protein BDY21DRAFT_370657 [Lineolata rhizophorae]|uniref:Uncharacterized protein n=1 Tax=Lineolata rhizophorae TaxID=578093 RepID=A0A6A6P5U3_9PEZI|nr:hypothetical protein BDY21DRAFT_370657 [Lineolata rhizophorae]